MTELTAEDRATISRTVELFTAARAGEAPSVSIGRILDETDPDDAGVALASTLASMTLLAKALAACLPGAQVDLAVQMIARRVVQPPKERP